MIKLQYCSVKCNVLNNHAKFHDDILNSLKVMSQKQAKNVWSATPFCDI